MSTLPRKRILKELVIDKIAAVDSPCNAHALATILKRADPTMESDMHSLDQLEVDVARLEKQLKQPPPPRKSKRGNHADLEDISDDDVGEDETDESDDESTSVKKRHRFIALAENLANEQGVPMAEAMTRARKKYPDLFASFKDYGMQKSFDALVQDEIRKGCAPAVAAQRIALLHPDAARDSIAKQREGDVADFLQAVGVYQIEHGCDRTVAMSEVRKRNPGAFGRFQNV